ncbi:MAG: prephenate dehydratase [Akkermansia sp.]|nr:prephenate dehydratase [Akkermansia sp.]
MTLDELRQEIDRIDAQIVELLKQRMGCVHAVGEIKKDSNSHIFVPERESKLFAKLMNNNAGVLPEKGLQSVYRQIVSMSFALEGGMKVGYLGPEGTWSHQAAKGRFGDSVELVPFPSFNHIFHAVDRKEVDYGIVPVENSTDGTVSQALDLLGAKGLRICAQVHQPVLNCLMSNAEPTDIRTIYSHPQALGQCSEWLLQHYPNAALVATPSTAAAACRAADEAQQGAAAIGSKISGELYGLKLINANIQDKADNTTRFAVIGRQRNAPSGKDRTTICFGVPHTAGSLVEVLNIFKNHGVNIYCMDSRPNRDTAWEYLFYMDVEGHEDEEPLKTCLSVLHDRTPKFKVLGSYPEQ